MMLDSQPLWQPAPILHRDARLPKEVKIYEVGPRDGLQSEPNVISTELKASLIVRLVDSGIRSVELTSFVSPKWVPQLADAEQLMERLTLPHDVRQVVLVPNSRGLARAIRAHAQEIAVFTSATESFAHRNLADTASGVLETARRVTTEAQQQGLRVRGYVSMCFGDPWEGPVEPTKTARIAASLYESGCQTIAISDTIGVATPHHVEDVVGEAVSLGVPVEALALHLHDTYGQALSNVYAALLSGVTEFDSSIAGLGRCPYAAGATGNLSTENLVWMLEGLGIETGVNLPTLAKTGSWISAMLEKPNASSAGRALESAARSISSR